jgi:hypothetical protein
MCKVDGVYCAGRVSGYNAWGRVGVGCCTAVGRTGDVIVDALDAVLDVADDDNCDCVDPGVDDADCIVVDT